MISGNRNNAETNEECPSVELHLPLLKGIPYYNGTCQ